MTSRPKRSQKSKDISDIYVDASLSEMESLQLKPFLMPPKKQKSQPNKRRSREKSSRPLNHLSSEQSTTQRDIQEDGQRQSDITAHSGTKPPPLSSELNGASSSVRPNNQAGRFERGKSGKMSSIYFGQSSNPHSTAQQRFVQDEEENENDIADRTGTEPPPLPAEFNGASSSLRPNNQVGGFVKGRSGRMSSAHLSQSRNPHTTPQQRLSHDDEENENVQI